jgi:calcium-dependent protein kinase
MKMLLKAIAHCHSYKIAHRDIKPENIMLNQEGHVTLIDFGLSKCINVKAMKSIVGSPYYVAPEVLDGEYGIKCDIWSLGVILYILMCGYLPFSGSDIGEIFTKIKEGKLLYSKCLFIIGKYSMHQKEWEKVSKEGKDLVKKMLEVNPKKRLTAQKCLQVGLFDLSP